MQPVYFRPVMPGGFAFACHLNVPVSFIQLYQQY
jgi:hypothetical protein